MGDRMFVYLGRDGALTKRILLQASESGAYIQGRTPAGDLRTFRKDRIVETAANEQQLEEILAKHQADPDGAKILCPPAFLRAEHPEVCFTGFSAADKARLSGIAAANGVIVVKGVTVGLHYLCCGANAGPAKLEKARAQGTLVLSEAEFANLLETGEVPTG